MSLDFFGTAVEDKPRPTRMEAGVSVATGHRWLVVAAFAVYTLTVLVCQRLLGAPQAAFGGYPDEPSHYISGLLVRDYLVGGSLISPLRYATDYYMHVPFFAVGYWPPLFYAAEALWMVVFGFHRPAILAFIASIAAGSATLLFACLRARFGVLAAFAAGLLFLLSPVVLWSCGLVMTDLSVTFLSFAAALALARYLDSERIGHMLVFSILAAATILTKTSGAFLALVPPAAVLVSRKLGLLRRFSFWVSPLVVGILCAPWFLLTRGLIGRGFENYQKPGLLDTIGQLGLGLGANLLWLAPFALIGAWSLFRGPKPMPGLAVVCLVQPAVVFVFLAAAPVGIESRYLTPAVPPLLVLTFYGIRFLADLAAPARRTLVMAGTVVLLTASFLFAALRLQPAPVDPLRAIADFVIDHKYRSVLVPADAEGAAIAEISERETDRLASFLIRPGKLLAQINWVGSSYRSLYKTKDETQALFDRLPFDAFIIRMNPPDDAAGHEILLRDMVLAYPNRWHLVRSFNSASSPALYAAYEPVKLRELSEQDLTHFLGDLNRSLNPLRR